MAATASAIKHDQIMVGFKPIDDLHREFEAILAALTDPGEADYGAHLLALHEHLLRHCATEEQFMLQENYSHYGRHQRAHAQLLESVSNVRRRVDAGDVDAVKRYAADLMNWFAIHASTEDRELAAFLKGRHNGPLPPRLPSNFAHALVRLAAAASETLLELPRTGSLRRLIRVSTASSQPCGTQAGSRRPGRLRSFRARSAVPSGTAIQAA